MWQTDSPDGTLIAAAKKGDLEAFNTLVLRYQKLVYNIALRMMGEGQSAEDATQEAFIKAHKPLYSYVSLLIGRCHNPFGTSTPCIFIFCTRIKYAAPDIICSPTSTTLRFSGCSK